jgi:hypothetical protein
MEAVNIAGQRPYAYLTHFFRVIVHLKGHYKPVLRIRDVLSRIRIRPLLHPGSRIRIPDPGDKKAPDPGSRIRIRNTDKQKVF